ncbi:MAG TPA: hypothetical protein VGH23_17110 [Rhizomicrobium sp.]|jgi:hypothetical protein
MQHLQLNFVWRGTNCLAFIMALAVLSPATAGQPDPLLNDGPTAPCAAGVDYSGGIDVNGNAVVPADVAPQHIPVPGQVLVPLHGNGNGQNSAYAAIDGKKLDALVNPPPCH